jgi:hypothetical protein
MRIRIYLMDKTRFELEADSYFIDPRTGALTIAVRDGERPASIIAVYAAGVWRSAIDVGAFKKALEAVNENSRAGVEEQGLAGQAA